MADEFPALVTIIIVNYDGEAYLRRCLQAVFQNTYPNYEVIVADNGSTDGSLDLLARWAATERRLQVVQLGYNAGPAVARNEAAKLAKGKYLAFLDNDTQPEPDWLLTPVTLLEADPSLGACQCKLLLLREPHRIDYVGDYLSYLGFLIQRADGGAQDTGAYDQNEEIFSAKSAAMVMRRSAFDAAGGFDPDYFIYLEETDLAWRVWLQGYRIIFVPESRVLHEFGTSSLILGARQNYFAKFHGCKNYISTLLKNLGSGALVRTVPLHVGLWCAMAGWLALKGSLRDSWYLLKGIAWVALHIPRLWRKRQAVQRSRHISDAELFPHIMRRMPLSYFYAKMATPKSIGNAEGFFRPAARKM